jgi:demethylmenaquinone methyltransferase / 2-methoxy-6-polyprenyl-1,4-benzoquinol methylase
MSTGIVAPRANDVARAVFTGLPARYDRLAYLLSFGQDRRWRGVVVERTTAASPARVLDVATGPAGVALGISRAVPAAVVGVDLNLPMLRQGVANVHAAARDGQVQLVAGRAEQLPFADEAFDAVSFSYLLRYVDNPAATIAEMTRCLRPGGTLSGLEFHVPTSPFWRAAWRLYTEAVLPVLGWVGGGRAWWRVGRFLGPSIRGHYARLPVAAHVEAWQRAGMVDVGYRMMSLGGGLVMWGTKGSA